MAIAQVQLKLWRHTFRTPIVSRHIRLDYHLLVRSLNRHVLLLPSYEWADTIKKVAMNRCRGVTRAFVELITGHDAGVHDKIDVDHVHGVNAVHRLRGIVCPNVYGKWGTPIVLKVVVCDALELDDALFGTVHGHALDYLSGLQQVIGKKRRLACKADVQGCLDDIMESRAFHHRKRTNVIRTHVD